MNAPTSPNAPLADNSPSLVQRLGLSASLVATSSMPSLAATVFARLALSAAFVSAVADRLGWWGFAGTPGVAWGNVEAFNAFVGVLNPWLPEPAWPALGWFVTTLELGLALVLLSGKWLRTAAWTSAALLGGFATAMTCTIGLKPVLDYSVLSAAVQPSSSRY